MRPGVFSILTDELDSPKMVRAQPSETLAKKLIIMIRLD